MTLHDPSGLIVTAIHLGGAPIGSVGLVAGGLSDTVLNSIANLAAIGLERSRANEATARATVARESSELRATVLDALAHEFKTPLTAMKAASSDLRASGSTSPRIASSSRSSTKSWITWKRLVSDAVQMLRIDAGDFTIHPERHRLGAVVEATLKKFDHRLEGHDVVVQVPGDLAIDADGELLALALRQLLDNALKYSPPASRIGIRAYGNGTIDVAVSNSGSTIPDSEQGRVFERFYRGGQAQHVRAPGWDLRSCMRKQARSRRASAGRPECLRPNFAALPRDNWAVRLALYECPVAQLGDGLL